MIFFFFVSGFGMFVLVGKFWGFVSGLFIGFCLKELEGGRSLDVFGFGLFVRFVWLDVGCSLVELYGMIIGDFL